MTTSAGAPWRGSPFARNSPSSSPLFGHGSSRPKSAILSSPLSAPDSPGHIRNQSLSALPLTVVDHNSRLFRPRTNSKAGKGSQGATFAPEFIKSDLQGETENLRSIEGENDFSGKRYVWVKDAESAFVRGWVVQETEADRLLIQCEDGSQRDVEASMVDKVNPAKFDKAGDMAELTHLNEPSVVHNLHMRYQADLIYTYSGLFLVTVNPYCSLPIYGNEHIRRYRGLSREENKPHIYAMADEAFRSLVEEGENQSILVTGESGAGKTENTKKVIQYLAAVATSESSGVRSAARPHSDLSRQILQANPILESFGNAQTVRNNNSSRFGKFIRIELNRGGQIAGAYIDWYLLEKSRVVRLNANERNYHVFYQLLRGADREMREAFLLQDMEVEDFAYTRDGNDIIAGVSDVDEWKTLIEAFNVMRFSPQEQFDVLRTIAAVLHLGNIAVVKESLRADQARLEPASIQQVGKVCALLGVPVEPFLQGLLHPRVRAGKELVEKAQTPEQVRASIDALAKGIYERCFGDLVSRINRQLDRTGVSLDDSRFIGVLDIAGFEIFEENSFEQLCINYTNEKLQQFFNHHMFVLEQEEYAREQIEWKFIDFGKDLQPTIDLIELPNPIGIFSCLDEDSVMPKATDKSFTEKLNSLWDKRTPKYRGSLLTQGFVLTHYAAEVEYTTDGWLEKNKDPINDNLTRLLAKSDDGHVASLFADCAEPDGDASITRSRVKKGLFRTVAQRHKEQLSSLMAQLHSTHPHFVRCILPNHKKRPKLFHAPLVLDQLRCNGVLEGIRIARTGFPNRLPFAEFRQRYEVLCRNMPHGYLDLQSAVPVMLEKLGLDRTLYRVGLTKVFFRAGVLAELEERRDALIQEIMCRFQSIARGFTQRRLAHKRLYRAEACRIIQGNFRTYLDLCENPWWRLLVKMKPLLGAVEASGEVRKRDDKINKLENRLAQKGTDMQRVEEERRRAETEVQRVQHTLESERALALDKEEIFKRLQHREMELSDRLTETVHNQEQFKSILDEKEKGVRQLQDDLRRLASELDCTQRTLENQRSLAADKDDFVRSLQLREAELNDKLMQAMNLQEELHSRLKQDATGSKRLEDERKRAEAELQRVQQLLESERVQTRAKDDTIQQLQNRAMELDVQLSETWHDQEQLEGQLDELIAAKRRVDEELHIRQQQLEQAAQTIANLETGKGTLESLLQECSDLHARLDRELSRCSDLNASVDLYKGRAEEYFRKLEQAEVAVLKASRAEQFAKSQVKEAEGTCASLIAERKQKDDALEKVQRQNQQLEARLEDMAADLNGAVQAKKRLQHELEDYRSHRALDIEDKEKSTEQTRRKYQLELSTVTKELEQERESMVEVRTENTRLREELERFRTRWDDEVVNSSTWAKEKSRLEETVHEVTASRDDAITAHEEAQGKIASLCAQIRSLQASVEDMTAERDTLLKDKRGMRARLNEAGERLEELAGGESPSVRNAVGVDRELGRLKSSLAQKEDIATAAVDKMRRAEALSAELQKDITAEREANSQLHKEKAHLEKVSKELQLKLVDLETKSYSSASHDVKFLHGRILELEKQLEAQEAQHSQSQRSMRHVDRTVRDLQTQLERRDQTNVQLTEDLGQSRRRIERLLQTVDELQASDSSLQLQARRAERDLREEKEKALRLERELDGWRSSLRKDRGSSVLVRHGATTSAVPGPAPTAAAAAAAAAANVGPGSLSLSSPDDGSRNAPHAPPRSRGGPPAIPQRKASNTKGFL